MIEGSTPTELQEIIFPNIFRFFNLAISLVVNMTAAAPSFIPDEFPGVTLPSSLNTVFSFFRSSMLRFGLGCSSLFRITAPFSSITLTN